MEQQKFIKKKCAEKAFWDKYVAITEEKSYKYIDFKNCQSSKLAEVEILTPMLYKKSG